MTISTEVNRIDLSGNGVTTSFSTSPMTFYNSTDLQVYVTTNATGAVTQLTPNTHYTVSGGNGATGSISTAGLFGAPDAGTTVSILRVAPVTQASTGVNGDNDDAVVRQTAFDKVVLLCQQLTEKHLRAVHGPSNEVGSEAAFKLPGAVARAGKTLGFDGSGNIAVGALAAMAFTTTVIGQIAFGAAGNTLAQDSNLSWDNTNKILTTSTIKGVSGSTFILNSLGAADVRLGVPTGQIGRLDINAVTQYAWDGTPAFFAASNNAADLGKSGNTYRTGYFGTSAVVPLVQASAVALTLEATGANAIFFKTNGVASWFLNSSGNLLLGADNTFQLADSTNVLKQVYTRIVDSGSAVSVALKTNNGTQQVSVSHTANAVNFVQMSGAATGGLPQIGVGGSDTNIAVEYFSKGTGAHQFFTNGGAQEQFRIAHVASATNAVTVTGSNGGNPTLGTTGGGIDISPATVRFPNIGTTANAANATLNAVGSNDLLRSTSSIRYKTEIEVLSREEALALLRKLRPITYASLCEQDDPYARFPGLIAEEVAELNPLFASFSLNDAGKKIPESVTYDRLVVPLIAGWQDIDARLAALEARLQ